MELLRFLKEYIASPKNVGGFTPSSRGLAELVTDAAKVSEASSVIEFGPGTGVFTEVIQRKLRADAKFFAIEVSEDFVRAVRERCPGVAVYNDSAVNAGKYLDEMGMGPCDCIVSGLPFALFEDALQDKLLDAALGVLKPGGLFVTFTYFLSPCMPRGKRFARKLEGRFPKVSKTPIVWWNFLPAFAYVAQAPPSSEA